MKKGIFSISVLVIFVSIIFVSCKSSEEKRLLQIGNDLIASSFSSSKVDSIAPMDSTFSADPKLFPDVRGLSPFIFQRIKENGSKTKIEVTSDHKFSEKGLRLYLLELKGTEKNKSNPFSMTITFNYQGGYFNVMSVSGGL